MDHNYASLLMLGFGQIWFSPLNHAKDVLWTKDLKFLIVYYISHSYCLTHRSFFGGCWLLLSGLDDRFTTQITFYNGCVDAKPVSVRQAACFIRVFVWNVFWTCRKMWCNMNWPRNKNWEILFLLWIASFNHCFLRNIFFYQITNKDQVFKCLASPAVVQSFIRFLKFLCQIMFSFIKSLTLTTKRTNQPSKLNRIAAENLLVKWSSRVHFIKRILGFLANFKRKLINPLK